MKIFNKVDHYQIITTQYTYEWEKLNKFEANKDMNESFKEL